MRASSDHAVDAHGPYLQRKREKQREKKKKRIKYREKLASIRGQVVLSFSTQVLNVNREMNT